MSAATTTKRKVSTKVNLPMIPPELRVLKIFTLWRAPDKVPVDANGKPWSPQTNPEHRMTWDEAVTAYQHHKAKYGIGIAVDHGIVGIDLDNAINENGKVAPWAVEIIEMVPAHWEISPSGLGLRGLIFGKKPVTQCSKNGFPDGGKVELWDHGKYVTLTGEVYENRPIVDRQEDLDALCAKLWPQKPKDKPTGNLFIEVPSSDRELARAALAYLNADDYDVWLRVGMCLQSLGCDGLQLWETWSRISHKYADGDCRKKWGTFKREDGLKLGTLFHMAEQAGWIRDGQNSHRNGSSTNNTNGTRNNQNQAEPEDDRRYEELFDEDLGITHAPAIKERSINWLWKYRLAQGKLTLLAGDGKGGKSQITLAIATAITNGTALPSGDVPTATGRVVIVSAEDRPEDTIKPRLRALGANLDNITFLKPQKVIRKPGKDPLVHPQSFADHKYWREVFRRLPDTKLMIIDTLPSYLGRGVNDSRNIEVRQVLEPFLDHVIEPNGISVIGIVHLSKSVDSRAPVHRILGSVAYSNLARCVYFVVRDPDNAGRRLFAFGACNLAPSDIPAIAFTIETREVVLASTGEIIETSAPVFEAEPVQVDLADLVSGKPREDRADTKKDATEWLRQRLQAGPVGSDIIPHEGDAHLGRPWKLDSLKGEARQRSIGARRKYWRESILKARLQGSTRKFGSMDSAAWFFCLNNDQWPPTMEAVAEAAAFRKIIEGAETTPQDDTPPTINPSSDDLGEVDL